MISKELLHHVCFEMLEKIHFVLELARVFTNGIIMSVGGAVDRALDEAEQEQEEEEARKAEDPRWRYEYLCSWRNWPVIDP